MNMGDDCGAFYDSRLNFNKTYKPNQRSPVASLLTELHQGLKSLVVSRVAEVTLDALPISLEHLWMLCCFSGIKLATHVPDVTFGSARNT